MPGFDIGHLILIFGIAMIVFGPERMQQMARTIGHTLSDLRRASEGMPAIWSDESDALAPLISPADDTPSNDPGTMTLAEHFNELRSRMVKGAVPILLAAVACFFFSDTLLHLLKAPAGSHFQINAFGPMDGFVIKWKVALYAGLILSSPIWIYQGLAFILPALTAQEKHYVLPALAAVAGLLLAGTAFGYVLLYGMVRVMIGMFGRELNYLPNANSYISFVAFFMLACGLVFELPVVLLFLVRLGVLRTEMLRRQRKIAYFVLFVFAEVITPVSDPIVAPLIVMVPLVILYEGAIFATRFVLPREGTHSIGASAA